MKATHHDRRPARPSPSPARRARAAFALAVAAVVVVAHAILLALAATGWLDPAAFAASAFACSAVASLAVACLAWRRLANADAVPTRRGTSPVAAETAANGRSIGPDTLAALHRHSRRRLDVLRQSQQRMQVVIDTNRRVTEQLKRAQRIAGLGSWEWRRRTRRIACSEEVFRLLGLPAEARACRAAEVLDFIHEEDRRAFRRWILQVARRGAAPGLDVRIRTRNGELRYAHILGEAIRQADRVVGVTGTVQEATERMQAIQQIHRLAYYDVLTELPNRSRFHEKLVQTLDLARRTGQPFAIMFVDLDRFKRINDTLGHHAGDDLLRVIAQRLQGVVRQDETIAVRNNRAPDRSVCRQGGDEFLVLLEGVATNEQAARVAERMLEQLAQPIAMAGQELFISASIGIVLYPRDGDDLDALLRNADVAMYHAKSQGCSRFAFYETSMRQATARRLTLEHELRRAIESEQFELHYQPQIDVRTGRIVALEALVRWNHPTLGMLWPQDFIPVAEDTGLIMAIWEWVFVTALIQHNAWREEGLPAIPVGVNLSSVQFADPLLVGRVKEIAQVIGVPFDQIELELTESALAKDLDGALATLQALRATGIRIAIDDFGTGYSSLSYLRQLPLDKLKLDHAFTADASVNDKGAAIARAIIAMAQSLDLTVVAEGVETKHQVDTLAAMGCTTMQGYLLCRPVDAAATTDLLRRHRRAQSSVAPGKAVLEANVAA